MAWYRITDELTAADLGVYEGKDEPEALDAFARDFGFDDFSDVCERRGYSWGEGRDDLLIEKVDSEPS